jgi:hypothetical protein
MENSQMKSSIGNAAGYMSLRGVTVGARPDVSPQRGKPPALQTPSSKHHPQSLPSPSMPCPKCKGTGRAELSEALHATLSFVRQSGTCSAAQLSQAMNSVGKYQFHPTAYNNRLEELRRAGLVVRERFGKTWLYRIAD